MKRSFAAALFILLPSAGAASAQSPIEGAVRDLRSPDADVRMRAVRMLKPVASPEAAIPLAAAVTDPVDAIQREAIAAALNIFLFDPVVPSRRVGLIVEVRHRIAAEPIFSSGPLALNGVPVPPEMLTALLRAARNNNSQVAVEALYAFGALAAESSGPVGQEMLALHGPELVGMLGVPDPLTRIAAARVIGRLFERRPGDAAVDPQIGDAVILALNDRERDVQLVAMDALGAMRYERAVQALTDRHQYYRDPRRNALGHATFLALSRIGHRASLPLFQEQLSGGNAATKILAIEGLARIGDAGLLGTIRQAFARERNGLVLLAEGFASVQLSGEGLDPLFDALAKSSLRDQAFRYLYELAPKHVARLGSRAQDRSARMRADVADLLGLSREVSALPVVEPLLQDKDPEVVRAAERALARLRRIQ